MARQRPHGGGTLYKRDGRGPWVARWYDALGRRLERSTRTTDKAAAERILAKRVADVALRRDGVIDARLDAINEHARKSIDKHLDGFKAKMRAGGRTEKHIRGQTTCVRKVADHAGWSTVADITADGVNAYAGSLKHENAAAQTIRNHLTAIKGFARWLVVNGKLAHDPLASIRMPNAKADRRRERRMLLHDEWRWLRSVTAPGPERFGMTGYERMLLYATAIQTGLRSGELRSLSRGRLFLDNEPPFVTCKAGSTKNRKNARLYVQKDLADDLRDYVAAKAPQAPVFPMPFEWEVADMLRADLADARREWLDAASHDPVDYATRSQSDFLTAVNHDRRAPRFP